MSVPKRQIRLGAFIMATGHHVAAWRDEEANSDGSFEHFVEMARIAEAACFDISPTGPVQSRTSGAA